MIPTKIKSSFAIARSPFLSKHGRCSGCTVLRGSCAVYHSADTLFQLPATSLPTGSPRHLDRADLLGYMIKKGMCVKYQVKQMYVALEDQCLFGDLVSSS